jgi:integrase
VKIDLPYLMPDTDRHGNERLFVRRYGRKIRIREEPGTKAFMDAYGAALEALEGGAPEPRQAPRSGAPVGTLGWLAATYFASVEFTSLPEDSQRTRRGIIEDCLREPIKPNSRDKMALCPLALLSGLHIRMLRDRKGEKKGAANNRLKYLSSMFSWSIERNPPLLRSNPARDVKPKKYATEGFHSWTADEVEQFETHHPIGSKPRLAFALMYYLGVRRGDAILLGRQHMRNGTMRFIPQKTRHTKMGAIELPIPSQLTEIIEATPSGDMTFLITEWGKPFTRAGFGNWFRDQCDDAGLPQCSAHGLRKARAAILAERGATDRQLMAVFGWESEKEATKYTKAANRKRLAADAMALPAREQKEEIDCPTKVPHRKKA